MIVPLKNHLRSKMHAYASSSFNRNRADEFLWTSFDFSQQNVSSEILIRLFNRGVRVIGLGHSTVSIKKLIYID